ncbi:unnamed protein product, partial [marine sediment metagenome]
VDPPVAGNAVLQAQLSPVLPPTRNFWKGPWATIHWIDQAHPPPVTLSEGQPYLIGDRFFARVRFIDHVGRVSVTNYKTLDIRADP